MFTPIGEKSRRSMILDLAKEREYGDVLTYEELEDLLGVDRGTMQSAVNQSINSLEREQSKTVEAVTNVGYRIVLPAEHMRIASKHQQKSRRSVRRAKSKVDYVDMSEFTQGEKTAVTLAAAALSAQIEFARRADIRYAKREEVEKFVSTQVQHNIRTADDMDEVKQRMARLEARLGDKRDEEELGA